VHVLIRERVQTYLSSIHMQLDDLCSEDGQRVYYKKRLLCSVTVAKSKKIAFI